MLYVNKIYSTIFLKEADNADTYFPFDSLDDFRVSNIERHFSEDHDCNYLFVTFEKQEGNVGG